MNAERVGLEHVISAEALKGGGGQAVACVLENALAAIEGEGVDMTTLAVTIGAPSAFAKKARGGLRLVASAQLRPAAAATLKP